MEFGCRSIKVARNRQREQGSGLFVSEMGVSENGGP